MKLILICFVTLFVACAFSSSSREEEDASDNLDSGPNHFQPMVAVLCGHGKLLNKYLDENRRWVTDNDPKAICTKDKLEILEYCRKNRNVAIATFFVIGRDHLASEEDAAKDVIRWLHFSFYLDCRKQYKLDPSWCIW
ncbi:hypothetical protein AVEN_159216-1 [Araneus ventricosus]|uniref:E1 domain-containing protein n=1 Tax=Araneus ventricosus TaxID=182803 RepID=A0A4Y2A064_ARAVE|nr:hypothetical protein AVEN_159216-1 [Araneus ventricosus]